MPGGRQGSPPLTRGKAPVTAAISAGVRITPAYAGKRKPPDEIKKAVRDHPRLRGEKLVKLSDLNPRKGSPPLTRGKALNVTADFSGGRITPAYAGKS